MFVADLSEDDIGSRQTIKGQHASMVPCQINLARLRTRHLYHIDKVPPGPMNSTPQPDTGIGFVGVIGKFRNSFSDGYTVMRLKPDQFARQFGLQCAVCQHGIMRHRLLVPCEVHGNTVTGRSQIRR